MTLTKPRTKTDQEIQSDVLAELNRDWRLKPAEVGVEVDDHVVTLTGTVSNYTKIDLAADVARRVAGVGDVANKLVVKTGTEHDDTKLAQVVRDALLWDIEIPEETIDSVVRDGVVTLKGTVEYWSQRQAAHDAVARLTGIKGVKNELVVVPVARGDQEILEEIRAALRRRPRLEEVSVSVDRGAVTLTGKVDSFESRSEAEHAASMTSGVKSVLNRIVVRS